MCPVPSRAECVPSRPVLNVCPSPAPLACAERPSRSRLSALSAAAIAQRRAVAPAAPPRFTRARPGLTRGVGGQAWRLRQVISGLAEPAAGWVRETILPWHSMPGRPPARPVRPAAGRAGCRPSLESESARRSAAAAAAAAGGRGAKPGTSTVTRKRVRPARPGGVPGGARRAGRRRRPAAAGLAGRDPGPQARPGSLRVRPQPGAAVCGSRTSHAGTLN